MSPSPQLAPPGSSSYDSPTLHVGDGTWDATRDSFLLPNLVGLNFATMRYNGMGNRFFTMAGYHAMIRAHGIIATITFLGVVPAAIFLMRFYGRRPRWALRLHIWLQILTLLLVTVVFILGWMAVGPRRSLTNPHHGIGLAIYVLIWFQIIFGCLVHRKEKNKRRLHIPLTAMLHHWFGRAIALLGIAQVALGLTLYGSPLYLFILYTFYVFALVVLYFILEWLAERRRARYGTEGSYVSEEIVEGDVDRRRKGGMGKWLAAGAGGLGLAALMRRRSSRNRPQADVVGTDTSGTSYISNEKYSASDVSRRGGFGQRLMQVGAVAGGVAAARRLFGRKDRDDSPDLGPYRPPLGGNQSISTDSVSRIEEGRPPRPTTPIGNSPGYIRPTHPLAQPPLTPGSGRPQSRLSTSSYSYSSYMSGSPSRRDRRGHTFRNALATGGAVYAVRSLFKNRRQRKEERRADELRAQRLDEERNSRMHGANGFTGDGVMPPRRHRRDRLGSQSASDISSVLENTNTRPGIGTGLPAAGVGVAAANALANRDRVRPVGTDPVIVTPGPASAMPVDVPPIPPTHRQDFEPSGSELYTTTSGRQRRRHRLQDDAAAGFTGAAVGAMAGDHSRRHSSRHTDSVESPPVSVKVKMHNDGRHVTLRRLTEEEAAAQRHGRRPSGPRRRRNSSFSDSSGGEMLATGPGAESRWRRTEALEAQQAAENRPAAMGTATPIPISGIPPAYPTPPPPGTQAIDPRTGQSYHVPPPPPIPGSVSNLAPGGSVTSPGTETSGGTEYANNRRRRRAERAQARLAREGRGQNTVDFT